MKLTQIAVDNPVFATMMMVALLVMGLFSYRQLGIDQFPNVDFPIVVFTTDYPGASPEEISIMFGWFGALALVGNVLLNRSIDFDSFDDLLTGTYPSSTDRNLLLSVAQTTWDRTDPSGHINHLLSDPYAGTPAKKALYQVAFGDHQVAPLTVEVAARTNGMSIHQPTLSMGKVVPDVTPYYDIPGIPAYPFDGSAMVIWDSGNPAPPIGNVPPPEITPMDSEWADLGPCPQGRNSDPHSCPRSNANARIQKSEFLKNDGMVVDVCGGAACLAP